MEKLSPSKEKWIKFYEESPEGKRMLDMKGKAVGTKVHYAHGCSLFSDFVGKTLTEIVNEYREDVQKNMYQAFDKWESVFEEFKVHLEKSYKSSTVNYLLIGAKNLINANVPRSLRLQVKSPEIFSRSILPIPMDDLKEVYGMCTVRERAIIGFLKDSGISREDALRLNMKDLEGFDKGDQWIHLRVYREKEHVEYETFLGPNAVEVLKAYFALRRQKGEILTPETPVFVSDHEPYGRLDEKTIGTIFIRLTGKTGKTISSHRLRKFFETYMALVVRHPIILKYWMGHKIRKGRDVEARYIIPPTPEQLKLYQEAYRNIDLSGGTLEEKAKEVAKEQVEKMLPLEVRDVMQKYGLKIMRKVSAPVKRKKRKVETNGGDCGDFKQIGEAELLEYLKSGWQIVHRLESGEVIVKR